VKVTSMYGSITLSAGFHKHCYVYDYRLPGGGRSPVKDWFPAYAGEAGATKAGYVCHD